MQWECFINILSCTACCWGSGRWGTETNTRCPLTKSRDLHLLELQTRDPGREKEVSVRGVAHLHQAYLNYPRVLSMLHLLGQLKNSLSCVKMSSICWKCVWEWILSPMGSGFIVSGSWPPRTHQTGKMRKSCAIFFSSMMKEIVSNCWL